MMGAVWVVGHPLLLVAVYAFIFQFVFKMRIGGTGEMPLDYTAYLLAGMLPWMAFAEVLGKAPMTMHANAGLVKQVVFPIEVLPVKTVLATLLTQMLGTGFLIVYVAVKMSGLPWTIALLPLLWGAQVLAMAGVSLVFAAVGAYFRDLKDFVQIYSTVGVYLMPVAYLPQWVPGAVRPLLFCNPFSYMVWCFQDACFYGRFQHPWAWLVFLAGSVLVFLLGARVFRKMKVGFGSVL
jgi:lipopolysaccharide transport system permease protein